MAPKTFAERVAINEQLLCECCKKRNRRSISRVCGYCMNKRMHLGEWNAKTLRFKTIKPWLIQADRLLAGNLDHPAVAAFRSWWSAWIKASVERPGSLPIAKWAREFKHEQADDALKLLAAIYLTYHFTRPHEVPSIRSLYFQMIKILVQTFIPASRGGPLNWIRIPAQERRDAAVHIQKNVGTLLHGFAAAVEAEQEQRLKLKEAMEAPLKIATVEVLGDAEPK